MPQAVALRVAGLKPGSATWAVKRVASEGRVCFVGQTAILRLEC